MTLPGNTVYIGIDDTDTIDSPGTNQLARHLVDRLPAPFTFDVALRHQLFFDPRVPYTSQNGSASIVVRLGRPADVAGLIGRLRAEMAAWFVPGSDPGLCVATAVPEPVITFARRAQREIVTQAEARAVARAAGAHLEGLGGTQDGVIGALSAVGLVASGDDGRVVHRAGWTWPDPFAGRQSVDAVLARGIDEVVDVATNRQVRDGVVDIGKHLRPAYRGSRVVLFVEPDRVESDAGSSWRAIKLP